ncbi:MAG: hypothetical protein JRM99_07760 [Nitrososphaerota archaeon]|nr:hypothetical protein [Nitrososphaerota archaeon]
MYKKWHRARKRKGLSEMIGALFILVLLVVSFSFALLMFDSFTGYQNAVNTRAQYNSQLAREQIGFTSTIFGASAAYNFQGSGTLTSAAGGNLYPVANMNFTSGATGWVFTRNYPSPGGLMVGEFDPVKFVGSKSGPGDVFVDYQAPGGIKVSAVGNWTYQFTLSSAEISALSSGTSTLKLSLGENLVNPGSSSATTTVSYILQDAEHPKSKVITFPVTLPASGWSLQTYTPALATQQAFFSSSSGVYNLIIRTFISIGSASSTPSEETLYFDDAGAVLSLTGFSSAAICPYFAVAPLAANLTQDVSLSLTSSYTQGVTQTVYLYSFESGVFVPVGSASVGSSAFTNLIDVSGLAGGISDPQRFIQTTSATVTPPGCSSIATSDGYVIAKVYSVASAASFSGSLSSGVLTDFYTDTGHVSFTVTNTGSSAVHLVSFWITGSTGPTQFASTLSGGSFFGEWVAPGQTVSATLAYAWSPGDYTIELVSSLGGVFTEAVTAS